MVSLFCLQFGLTNDFLYWTKASAHFVPKNAAHFSIT